MTARKCFSRKIAAGKVREEAGRQVLDMLDRFEAEHAAGLTPDRQAAHRAALEAAELARAEAARDADLLRRSAIAQANVERAFKHYDEVLGGLRQRNQAFGNAAPLGYQKDTATPLLPAVRSLLIRDPHEIGTWGNVQYTARQIRGAAHASFADGIEALRPKMLGLKPETSAEADVLAALYGEAGASPQGRAVAEAWARTAEDLRKQFVGAGGALPERKSWRLPNPAHDAQKVATFGRERWKDLVRPLLDRDDMLDFTTGQRLGDARLEQVLDQVFDSIVTRGIDGPATAVPAGRPMLANQRDVSRVLSFKDAEAWRAYAEAVGEHASPYETMLAHIGRMADEIALMRVFGPNPEATKRFILNLFDREGARLQKEAPAGADAAAIRATLKENRRAAANAAAARRSFETLWAEVTHENNVPVNPEIARVAADLRSVLVGAQMGSAIISSITDPALVTMTARLNGLSVTGVMRRALEELATPGSEIRAARMGLVADTLAHALGETDRFMGQTIRTGVASKIGPAVIRASGLRRWTAALRNGFALEMMGHVAENAGKAFGELDETFRTALGRYGIGPDHWEAIRTTGVYEPRPGATFIRPLDVREGGSQLARDAADRLQRMIDTEMDFAVIEGDPMARAWLIGDTRPGTLQGEFWRSAAMYKTFPLSLILLHWNRALARGFDGTRLAHAGLTFLAMWTLGMVALQAKNIANGKDPQPMDPTEPLGLRTWGAAALQGGGLGIFGDLLFADRTRVGSSLAPTLLGSPFATVEGVLGDFLMRNVQRLAKGEETHFAGDALYVGARLVPGSNLWYWRLGFQRQVIDRLALEIDPRAPERFRRMEREAERNFGQEFWWRPGQRSPERAPALSGAN